ncbi:alcohol dehydrogenase catalytic domain-containing protein [Yinghuangia seranimata]|uniref:alcohol dehydrogenase catalytic domain-containing protein n=1 Tax=Yinghuangia seranimata TaxID=408067 RepID=UPI00248C2590|nr:alcohol dehydrogenase catalytic domain-containing protein [Yinghuangia seranimata]MDI2127175.1 alcohol dehydrogenase catalytic domain-containing protein [Yinghuangia seranimata]
MRAAVLSDFHAPLAVRDDVEIAEPGPGEVMVRVVASGICGSDLKAIDGKSPVVRELPAILGHESAGIVEEVGPGVTMAAPGDRVIVAMTGSCGRCEPCRRGAQSACRSPIRRSRLGRMRDGTTRLRVDGAPAYPFIGIGSFAEYAVVNEEMLVPVPDALPLEHACLLACGVITGVGAVLNTAAVEPGATVLVVGAGGVGLNVLQGAVLAGAARIVVADVNPGKLELATGFGATDVLLADGAAPLAERVAAITDGGVDYAFDATGHPGVLADAFAATRDGGTTVMVGSPPNEPISLLPQHLFFNRTLKGCAGGGGLPARDLPRLIELAAAGRLDLARLITAMVPLDGINDAFDDLRAGRLARAVVRF